jgi:hypothetical protein
MNLVKPINSLIPKMKKLIKWLLRPFNNLKKHFFYGKLKKRLEVEFVRQLQGRKELRKDINIYLRKLFNSDGKSRYIPPSFKNSEEVRFALQDKFGDRIKELNLKLDDFIR